MIYLDVRHIEIDSPLSEYEVYFAGLGSDKRSGLYLSIKYDILLFYFLNASMHLVVLTLLYLMRLTYCYIVIKAY